MAATANDFSCPNCGADVPAKALACPECGADEETGWSEDAAYDGLDLPDQGWGQAPTSEPMRSHGWRNLAIGVMLVLVLLWVIGWVV